MKKISLAKKILIGILAVLILLCVAVFLMTHILMKQNFGRGEYSEYSLNYRYDFYEKDYPRHAVNFESGKNTLQGYVYGEENDKGLVIFSHGIGGGHEGYINEIIWFVNQGYCVFAFDNTGSCESEGDGTKGLSQSALDLHAALNFIENDSELSKMKKLLIGHSWGGFAVTAILNFDHDITASASVAGYAYPVEMITEFGENLMGDLVNIAYPFICLDNWLIFGKYANLSAVEGINKSDIPVMVIHGTEDGTIGYNRSAIISKKDSVTNPNVEYLTISDDAINGHSSIFYSQQAGYYRNSINAEYAKIKEQYPDGVPENIVKEFYEKVDYAKANGLNTKMLEQINLFYEKALAN